MFTEQRHSLQSLLLPLVAANAVALALCAALYLGLAAPIKSNNLETEGRRLDLYKNIINGDIDGAISDLRLLATGDAINDYLANGNPADLERAERRAVFVSKDTPDFDQIRYIDEKGQEEFRVNWNGAVVPREQLQNKASRDYFQKANALAPGQIFISTIDLNIENGVIERPLKPTLRLALPLFDASGRHRGIYVINYRAENLINQLRQYVPRRAARLRLLNEQGYWLAGPSPETEWGFQLPERAASSLAKTDPGLWAKVQANPAGQERYQDGYFTWEKIEPADFAPGKPIHLVSDDSYIVLAAVITPQEWADSLASLRETFLALALILVVLTSFMTRFFLARREAQQERDRFFNLSRDLLCVAGRDGYFKRVNPAWATALGYTPEEMTSQPFLNFVHPDDRDKTAAEARRAASGQDIISFENRYRCKDGTYRWLLWSGRTTPEDGTIYASGRDMTERKEAAERIENLNRELQSRADLLEAANKELESFSYSVSHDLRAPLRHIHGFVEILQKSPAFTGQETAQRQMGVIAKAAREMGMLIDDLIAFSRTGRTQMQTGQVNMRDVVDQCIRDLELETAGRRVAWNVGDLSPVEGDAGLLRLVWTNLLGNAVKYTRPRPEARIEIGQEERRDAGGQVRDIVYFVRDNGVGFNMAYATKLFGVFQRLHRAEDFEGTGIGLANVQRIIHRHGGKVWAESQVDGGATFYFSLPVTSTGFVPSYSHGKN